ncbi:MAG TPA: hypothetical protein DCQ36_07345 [Actinobacteria bacterium]|nr:hypothetical protein [Actinomycetota bacterium]
MTAHEPAHDRAYATLLRREQRRRPTASHLAAALLVMEALVAVGLVLVSQNQENQALDLVVAALLALAALMRAARWNYRCPLHLLQAYLVMAWGAPMVFIATSSDEASQLLWGAMVMLAALITTFSLPPRSARYQVALMVVVYLLVTVGLDPKSPPLFDVGFVLILVLGCYTVAWIRADQAQLLEVIADMATTDTLTGLLNRRGLKAEADIVHANATRAGGTTIVALVDLDGLKRFNDRHGHHAGDAHITAVTSHWRGALREGDLIARVGGDEFVMVLPRADEAGVRDLLTRIRDNAPGPWSQGWTVWAPNEPLDAAIERADALMYVDKARRNGGPDHSTHG